jgi:hypothetical protein
MHPFHQAVRDARQLFEALEKQLDNADYPATEEVLFANEAVLPLVGAVGKFLAELAKVNVHRSQSSG